MAEVHSHQALNSDEPTVTVEGGRFAMVPEALLYDPTIDPTAKAVYGVLRRHGESPEHCFPSHATIGALLGLAERSINRPVVALEAAGWIKRVRRARGLSCSYIVYGDRSRRAEGEQSTRTGARPPDHDRAQERGETAQESAAMSAHVSAPNESNGTRASERETPTTLPLTCADPFDAFWANYPRKVEKKKARGKWLAQIKRRADPRDLIAAAENYAKAKRGTPPDKIKYPASFLSADDVWRDWLDGGAALAEAEQGEVYVSDEPIYS